MGRRVLDAKRNGSFAPGYVEAGRRMSAVSTIAEGLLPAIV
jgi:hypothetical protein